MPTTLTKELIEKAKKNLSYPSQLFINGKYDNSITGKTFDNISPINGKLINKVVFSQKEDVENQATISEAIGNNKNIFLKIDIEGDEFKILEEIYLY